MPVLYFFYLHVNKIGCYKMIEMLKGSNLKLPREDSVLIHLPLIDSLNSRINKTPVPTSPVGNITQTSEGFHFNHHSYISLPSDVGILNEFTQGGWFKRKGAPSYQGYHIMFGGVDSELSIDPNYAIRCGVTLNNVRYCEDRTYGAIAGNEWYHLAMSYSPSGNIRTYINGIFQGTINTGRGSLKKSHCRRIGEYCTNSYSSNALYRGMVIYNEVLTDAEIVELMDVSFVLK